MEVPELLTVSMPLRIHCHRHCKSACASNACAHGARPLLSNSELGAHGDYRRVVRTVLFSHCTGETARDGRCYPKDPIPYLKEVLDAQLAGLRRDQVHERSKSRERGSSHEGRDPSYEHPTGIRPAVPWPAQAPPSMASQASPLARVSESPQERPASQRQRVHPHTADRKMSQQQNIVTFRSDRVAATSRHYASKQQGSDGSHLPPHRRVQFSERVSFEAPPHFYPTPRAGDALERTRREMGRLADEAVPQIMLGRGRHGAYR